MSSKKTYIVFRCSNCGFYGLASPKQKTRLCVRCGKTMILEHTYARSAENFNEARRLIGELNAKRSSETLDGAGQLQTIPAKNELRIDQAKASSKGLLRTFQEVMLKHVNKEIYLQEFLGECEINGIPRDYAQKLVKQLVDSGQAYRPGKDKITFL